MTSNVVDISIERGPVYGNLKNKVGLRLRVKSNQELEQFMRNLSNGKTIPIESYTEDWIRIPHESQDVYAIDFGRTPKEYTLSAIGLPLLFDVNRNQDEDAPPAPRGLGMPRKEPTEVVNLSFLTLVGISREEGVTIGISGVYSFEYIQKARTQVIEKAKQFLHDYIVPVTINLSIVQKI